jgi:hypothetical protein
LLKRKKVIAKDTTFFGKSNSKTEKSGHFIRRFPFFPGPAAYYAEKRARETAVPSFFHFFPFSG